MISKNQVVFVRSLQQKKQRREHGLFIAEGAKIVPEMLRSDFKIREIYALESWCAANRGLAGATTLHEVTEQELARISGLVTPNEALAVAGIPRYELDYRSAGKTLTLVLDDIRDPGNLGTLIRIADWFGIRDIVCSEETAEAWNPKVVQASMGSITRVRIHYTALVPFFEKIKSAHPVPVYGAFLEGESIYKTKFGNSGFLVIGNEAHGISPEVASFITKKITIPSFSATENKTGEAESLNAAVAAAVICSEIRRNG
ncbi:MAG: rRNA methylase [Bacteroidetes bacterium]|nr:MAG: rRNA methylase [Bacteroidota bacterium]